jgi:ribonuclease-3
MYLDLGMEVVKEVVLKIVVKYIDSDIDFLRDYKSKLQELVQTGKQSVVYELVSETGPAHNKTFVTEVIVDGIVLGTGTGNTKKSSEQMAAKEALAKQAK